MVFHFNFLVKVLFILCIYLSSLSFATHLRVVSLSPVSTEIIATINIKTLVGVSQYCNYPEFVKTLPKVGGMNIDYEKVLALYPDKVIGIGISNITKEKFEKLGVATLFIDSAESINDILKAIQKIGDELDESKKAGGIVASMNRTFLSLKKERPKQRKTAVVMLQYNPIIVAGSQGFIAEILTLSGAKSVIESKKMSYPRLTKENIIKADPDFIVCGYPNLKDQLLSDHVMLMTQAGRKRRIINSVNPDLFLRPGPRIIEGIKELKEALK